jgi:hypothetical protein
LLKAYYTPLSQNTSFFQHFLPFLDPDESVVKAAPAFQLEVSIAFVLVIAKNSGIILNEMSTGNFMKIRFPEQ